MRNSSLTIPCDQKCRGACATETLSRLGLPMDFHLTGIMLFVLEQKRQLWIILANVQRLVSNQLSLVLMQSKMATAGSPISTGLSEAVGDLIRSFFSRSLQRTHG